MYLDEELKKLRKQFGITQEYLAKKLYVSVQTINKWENVYLTLLIYYISHSSIK